MEQMEYFSKMREIIRAQEAALRFEAFTNKDALKLGNFFVDKMYEEGVEMTVAIRKINGAVMFQYMTENTGMNNQTWMLRKFNTVAAMETSSLQQWAAAELNNEPVSAHGMNSEQYVFAGGGFPIKLKNGMMAAVLTVSNQPHLKDHGLMVKWLKEYLNMPEVPEYEY